MKLCTLFLASLALTYLPLSLSYRDGARSESCYNMLVMHADFLGRIVSPTECGDPCRFQLLLIRRVFEGNRLAPLETTYQCGETYHCKWTLGSKVCLFVCVILFVRISYSAINVYCNNYYIWGLHGWGKGEYWFFWRREHNLQGRLWQREHNMGDLGHWSKHGGVWGWSKQFLVPYSWVQSKFGIQWRAFWSKCTVFQLVWSHTKLILYNI